MVMADYARERREYISQIRSSFGEDAGEMQMHGRGRYGREQEDIRWQRLTGRLTEQEERQPERTGRWMRVRFFAAVSLFLLFFFWQSSGKELYGITPAKMIDMIEDNRYDTILQEYDAVLKERILE